jgi:hypothetical protein
MEDFNLRDYLYNNPLLEATKKGNEEEQKRYEGAIRDDRDHIKSLEKDIGSDEKKLSKLKKDKKKDVKEDKLREYIRGKITSILQEAEEEEEDVDVDVEDVEDIDIDVEKEEDITIDDEESEVETDIDVKMPGGLDPAVEMIQGLLTKAQQQAEKLGDPKLLDQIGNTITFFTRKHIVKGGLTENKK